MNINIIVRTSFSTPDGTSLGVTDIAPTLENRMSSSLRGIHCFTILEYAFYQHFHLGPVRNELIDKPVIDKRFLV